MRANTFSTAYSTMKDRTQRENTAALAGGLHGISEQSGIRVFYVQYPEKAMAPHSSTLAWKIPWMEEPGGLQSMGSLESDATERLHFDFSLSCIGEGNGNPLQCSCLENPRDGGAWWAAVSGVAQSRTRLKRLRSSSSSRRVSVKLGRRKLIRNSKRDDK